MNRSFLLAVLSIISISCFVNAGDHSAKNSSGLKDVPSSNHQIKTLKMSLDEFLQKAMKEGEDDRIGPGIGGALGFDHIIQTKAYAIVQDETTDGKKHDYHVLMEKSADQEEKPTGWILSSTLRRERSGETHYFRLGLDGKPIRAMILVTRKGEDGKTIPGSGVVTNLDITSPKTKTELQHELDFWLKGMYRKKAAAPASGT